MSNEAHDVLYKLFVDINQVTLLLWAAFVLVHSLMACVGQLESVTREFILSIV